MELRPDSHLNRRELLHAGATGTLLGLSGCAGARRTASTQDAPWPELMDSTIAELQEGLASGLWTARALCEACLDRIEAIDKAGPALNAIIEVNPDALAHAERLDIERRAGRIRGPLHGIPILLKDNIDTADRMQTTAGSLALVDSGVSRDAWITARIREGGLLLLGKTNLSEWANFRSRESTSGWSGRGGLTLNPYALDRNPCGSSSGSAVAVSAGLAPLAIGTETNGSIVCPASVNGVVGIKPTVGLAGRSGIVPISHSQDTAGPMARCVADAAALLGLLAGSDPRDASTRRANDSASDEYTRYLDPKALLGARIGLVRNYWGLDAKMDFLLNSASHALRMAGAELVDVPSLPGIGSTREPGFKVLLYEFKAGLKEYLGTLGPQAKVRSLEDVIRFNEEHSDVELPHFGQDILESAMDMGPLAEPDYKNALALSQGTSREAIDGTVRSLALDALFGPTTGPAWVTDLAHGDRSSFPGSASAAAQAGYPHVTVPGGIVSGLPVGVSFFGPAWSERRLIALAYAFEQATKHRQVPQMLPTAPA